MFATTLTFNIIPLIFTLFTGFGVVVHDTKLDHAATTALSSLSAGNHSTGAVNGLLTSHAPDLRSSDHTHTETINIAKALKVATNLEPHMQTRMNEEKKHISPKKLPFNTSSI